jgi:hypothetical protein
MAIHYENDAKHDQLQRVALYICMMGFLLSSGRGEIISRILSVYNIV